MFYILNFIPILINILFLPFWWLEKIFEWPTGCISCFQMLLNAFAIPIFLCVINAVYIMKEKKNIWLCLIIMVMIIFIDALILYINWGITSGNMFHPDSMTVGLLQLIIKIPLAVIFIGVVVFFVYKFIHWFIKR